MGTRKVTMELIKEFNDMYNTGASRHEIAKNYNIHEDTIAEYIHNPRLPGKIPLITEEIGQAILTLRGANYKMDAISRIIKISEPTIYVYLRKLKKAS